MILHISSYTKETRIKLLSTNGYCKERIMKIPQLQHQIKTSQPNHWKNNWMNGFPWFMESNQINIIKTPNSNSLYTLPLVMYLYTYQISLESVIIEIRIHSSITFISLFSCWYQELGCSKQCPQKNPNFLFNPFTNAPAVSIKLSTTRSLLRKSQIVHWLEASILSIPSQAQKNQPMKS